MPTRGIDEDGNLDEGTLRRFVFQTYGRARRTQDSPIMPDVWLRYIRIAEAVANFNIARDAPPGNDDPPPDDTVDLLLTMSSGERPGRIVKKLQDSLGSKQGIPAKDYALAQRRPARIALSDSRIVARANFNTLVCYIVPLSGWWRSSSRTTASSRRRSTNSPIMPKNRGRIRRARSLCRSRGLHRLPHASPLERDHPRVGRAGRSIGLERKRQPGPGADPHPA